MSFEQDWLDRKEAVHQALEELLEQGFSLSVARQLAEWDETLEFDNFSDLQPPNSYTSQPGADFSRTLLEIKFSRAATRVSSEPLEGNQLDAGVLYAIHIPDIPELGIDSVTFSLDGSPVHTEASAPWDYDGTQFDGTANRVTFVIGPHEVEAEITDSAGTFSISAAFNVE